LLLLLWWMGEGEDRLPDEAGEVATRGNRFWPGEKMLVFSLLWRDRPREN
jgi:hypothetical protein